MAITIKQTPSTIDTGSGYTRYVPNGAYTNLMYVLSSSNATQPQFRYVTTIKSGSQDLTTIKTYPNETNNGIIDVAPVLQSYMGSDEVHKTSGYALPVNTNKLFNFDFGEEYGTSISSSTTIYTGSATDQLRLIPARVYKNENSYNFDYGKYIQSASGYLTNDPGIDSLTLLPNGPNGVMYNSNDYQTFTLFSDEFGTPSPAEFQVDVRPFLVQNGVYSFPPDLGNYRIIITGSVDPTNPYCVTFGIGPQNLAELDANFSASLAAGNSNFLYSSADQGAFNAIINDKWDGIQTGVTPDLPYRHAFSIQPCPVDEYTRFSWINEYGFWDYYNVYNPLKKTLQVDRSTYHKPFVRYNETLSSYNASNRGLTQYDTDYTERFSIQTEYISRPYANWLTEMFESSDVRIQEYKNGNAVYTPINILNKSSRWQLSDNREKLFQYTIEFKYANDLQSR
jgi:hypothetical protein